MRASYQQLYPYQQLSTPPQPLLVRLPPFLPVPLRLRLDRLFPALHPVDPSSDDDHVRPGIAHHLFRRPVLLPQLIPAGGQPHPGGHDQPVPVFSRVYPLLRDKPDDKLPPGFARHSHRLFRVLPSRERAFGRHVGEQQKRTSEGETDRREAGDDTRAGDGVRIGQV